MAWNERDFRNISIRNLNICTMRPKLVGGDCWYRKKQSLDSPFILNHLQIYIFLKELETKER